VIDKLTIFVRNLSIEQRKEVEINEILREIFDLQVEYKAAIILCEKYSVGHELLNSIRKEMDAWRVKLCKILEGIVKNDTD